MGNDDGSEPRRSQVAEGKRKVQYVVTDEWYAAVDAQARRESAMRGYKVTMTDIVTGATQLYLDRAASRRDKAA